jgi:hypothetical protein
MKLTTLALAAGFALSSTLAFAQAGAATTSPDVSKSTDGSLGSGAGGTVDPKKTGTTGAGTGNSNMPSNQNSSIQGAPTAGSAEKTGTATSPGGTMKK